MLLNTFQSDGIMGNLIAQTITKCNCCVNLILAGTPSLSMERSDWDRTIAFPALEPTSSAQMLSLVTLCSPALFSVYLVQATSLSRISDVISWP